MNENFINTWVSNIETELTPNKRAYIAKRRQHGFTLFDKTHPLIQVIMKSGKKYSPADSLVISPKLELMGRLPVNERSRRSQVKHYMAFLERSLAGKLPGLGKGTSVSQSTDWEPILESGHGVTDALKVVLTEEDPEQEILSTFRTPESGPQDYTVVYIDVTAFENGGWLTINLQVGDAEAKGSFDLYRGDSTLLTEGMPIEGSPHGALTSARDVPPGQGGTIDYYFDQGQVFKLGATGNQSSEKGSINGFLAEISVEPNQKQDLKSVEPNRKQDPKNVSPILSYLSPEDVMNAFVKAFKNLDLEAMHSMLTERVVEEGGIELADVPEDMRPVLIEILSHTEVLSSQYVGDEFHFRLSIPAASPPTEATLKMRKVEGTWLIYDIEPFNED